jgi:hemerythrin-like domain-containing protein
MASNKQHPLYAPIHKGLRSRLFEVSAKAGRMDCADQDTLNGFYDEFGSLVASIRSHHSMEENFFHPLLAQKVPGGAEKLEEEHHIVDRMLDNLMTHLDMVRSKSTDSYKRRELGQEFYLAYNRFIAFFLNHIDGEEEHVQPALKNLCTARELDNAEVSVVTSQKPEEGLQNLQMMLSAANVDDIAEIIAMARDAVPPELMQGALQLAESILDARNWGALKEKVGIK